MKENIIDIFQNATQQLQKVVEETPQRIKELNEIISRADLETQDLLHLAELDNFDAESGYILAHQLKRVRIKRRKAKDEVDMLISIKAIINQNSKFEPHVNGIKKLIDAKNYQHARRSYTARVRTDLTWRFKKALHTKVIQKDD